jgi:enoyl-CoA hydratase/carnithine racemase
VKLGLSEVRVGVSFPVGPLEIARGTLSTGAFRRLLLGGQPIGVGQAMEEGIVDDLQSAELLMARAVAVARDYARIPPRTYGDVKAQMRAPVLMTVNAAIEQQSDPARAGWFSDETKPAMTAMLSSTRKQA